MGTRRAERSRRIVAFAVLSVGAFALAGCFATSSNPVGETSAAPEGAESEFERDVRTTFASDWVRAAVAVIGGGRVQEAYVDADSETVFEIGSTTQALTGELLAIAVERGEVALDDAVGAYLPLGEAPAAGASLQSLATHTSGLPVDPSDAATTAALAEVDATRADPFDYTLEQLLELARLETLTNPGEPRYSNFGAALLGHALASAAGTDYESLLEERLLTPLGMDGAVLVKTEDDVPEAHAGGHLPNGDPVEPWSAAEYGPAGGLHATLPDLVALAQAVLDGPLSESPALEPVVVVDEAFRVGYLWEILEKPGRTFTIASGYPGGFSAALVIDRDAGQASIVMINVVRGDADDLARRYLVGYADG